jgi:hypothetical protein
MQIVQIRHGWALPLDTSTLQMTPALDPLANLSSS